MSEGVEKEERSSRVWRRWLGEEPDSLPEEPLFCHYCGTTISSEDLFCPRCGEKVEKGSSSPGWGWYLGLAILAMALFLCILGIGVLGVLHGLEERSRLRQEAALLPYWCTKFDGFPAPVAMVVGSERLQDEFVKRQP